MPACGNASGNAFMQRYIIGRIGLLLIRNEPSKSGI
jgi:hypothetical protein